MTYLSYSRGYKSGGYEQRLTPGTPQAPHFDPEYVDSYEFGLKAALLESSLQLGLAIFQSDYTDLQMSVVDGPAPTLTNAGDATLVGAELEVSWRPIPELTMNAFAGYLDAEYDSLSERALRSGVSLSNRLPNSSEWQYGVAAGYELGLGSSWVLRPYVEWSYRSDLYLDAANEPLLHQDGYDLLSAALTVATVDDRWAVSLSGRNLLDETYLVSGLAQYNIGEIEGQYERPRQWMLSAKYRF
jgi:iron complex outermembrane receptor protein